MNEEKKPQPTPSQPSTPSTKEEIERSDWEGMGQQRFQPEPKEDKGDKPAQIDPKNKKLDATPGANSLAGQIEK